MFQLPTDNPGSRPELYLMLQRQLSALLEGERDFIANAANFSSLLYHLLPDLNWAGFYILRGEELVLGPFQGRPACVRIALGRGVCGTAAATRTIVVVPNVHEFDGHIACDNASNSEIVLPVIIGGEFVAVLDLDSPIIDRFHQDDRIGLEELLHIFAASTDLP